MPLLSDKANMEYNPNSIFGTSQKLRTIALKNLENSAENADIATSKRPIDIKDFYEEFLSELVGINAQLLTIDGYTLLLAKKINRWLAEPIDEMGPEQRRERQIWDNAGDLEGVAYYLQQKRYEGKKNPIQFRESKMSMEGEGPDYVEDRPLQGSGRGKGKPKKIVGKYLPRFTDRFTGRPEPNSWVVANVGGEKMTGGSGKGKRGRPRKNPPSESSSSVSDISDASSSHFSEPSWRGTRPDDMLGEFGDADSDFGLSTVGTNPSNASSTWETIGSNSTYRGRAGGDPSDSEPSDSDSDSDSDYSTLTPNTNGDPSEQDAEALGGDEFDGWENDMEGIIQKTSIKANPMLFTMTKLIALISKANILFNARIKKNINYFDRLDVEDMANKVDDLQTKFNFTMFELVEIYLDNGEALVKAVINAFDKLYNDVAIAVKSYAQKAQSGGSISGGSLKKLSFQEFYKNCPTKYLL
jgi:hypothetical protein